MAIGHQSFYQTALTSGITSGDLVIPLDTVPTPSEGFLVIESTVEAKREIIYYTSKDATTVTCPSGAGNGRGYDGTTAVSHLQGATVIMAPVGVMFEKFGTVSLGGINDTNGNELLKVTATGSAVNELTLANAATGNAPVLSATGGDTNIDIELTAKGAGDINLKPGTANFVQKNGYPIDWWEEIGRTTLSGAGDTLSVASLPARKYLKIIFSTLSTGGTTSLDLTFNADTGNNYSRRSFVNIVAGGTATSAANLRLDGGAAASNKYGVLEILNISAQEKIGVANVLDAIATGAGTAPSESRQDCKWANTSAQISTVTISNLNGTGDFAIGSEVVVLGHN